MKRPSGTVALALFLSALAAVPAAGAEKCSGREGDPDCALYLIARQCIDTSAPDYCSACPTPRSGYCPQPATCDTTTEVWTGTSHLVVLRDRTMCSCPQVTHGLALPTGAVTGVEDPDRPAAIWKFAWGVTDPAGITEKRAVLVANPPGHRSQNQLHIHILPLDPSKVAALEATPVEEVSDLLTVWAKADALAASSGLKTFGIVVHKAGAAWHVHVADALLTDAYTLLSDCSKPARKR